jgi:hypothetical protein
VGAFLADPLDVPPAVLGYVAAQLGVADLSCVKRYTGSAGSHRQTHEPGDCCSKSRPAPAQTVCSGAVAGSCNAKQRADRPKRLAQSYGPTPSTQTLQDQLFGPWPHGSY